MDDLCPCPKSVPGCPNLTHPGALLFEAVIPSRPLLRPKRPKYSAVQPTAQSLADNSPKSRPQYCLAWYKQDVMAQMKPHSQPYVISTKDL